MSGTQSGTQADGGQLCGPDTTVVPAVFQSIENGPLHLFLKTSPAFLFFMCRVLFAYLSYSVTAVVSYGVEPLLGKQRIVIRS